MIWIKPKKFIADCLLCNTLTSFVIHAFLSHFSVRNFDWLFIANHDTYGLTDWMNRDWKKNDKIKSIECAVNTFNSPVVIPELQP